MFITVFWWGPRIVLDVCVVFLCFVCLLPVCPMFPMSLDCSFLGSLRFSLTFLYNSTTVSKDFQDPISQHNLTLFQFSRLAFKIKKKTKYKKKPNFQRILKLIEKHLMVLHLLNKMMNSSVCQATTRIHEHFDFNLPT